MYSTPCNDSIYDDEARKLRFFHFAAIVSVPVLLGFLLLNISKNYLPGVAVDIFLLLLMGMASMYMRFSRQRAWIYRSLLFLVAAALLYGVWIGSGEGTMLLWLFMLPLLYYFYFGCKEGLIWCVLTVSLAIAILLYPNPEIRGMYGFEMGYRFVLLYGLTTALAYGLEKNRFQYSEMLWAQRREVLEETRRLEKALADIHLLKGLLPICSNCKNIRNEDDEWEETASYFGKRSSAQFSHAICPSCADSLFLQAQRDSY